MMAVAAVLAYLIGLGLTYAVYRRRIAARLAAEDVVAILGWPFTATLLLCQRDARS